MIVYLILIQLRKCDEIFLKIITKKSQNITNENIFLKLICASDFS